MPSKKENIFEAALSLFANHGFEAVSTAKIAKKANCSEALIFRHFKSKKGLLRSILGDVEAKVGEVFGPVIMEENPEKCVRMFINTIFEIEEADYNFWRLSFKLKWDQEFYNPKEMDPILKKVAAALKKLGYDNPKTEAEMLYQNIESIAIGILRDGKKKHLKYRKHLNDRYFG